MKKSPGFKVPFCTRMVATGPRPLSTRDSSTVPLAGASGLAFSSRKSATSKIISSSLSMPFFCFAETSTNSASPPHSEGIKPSSVSCRFTRSGCARRNVGLPNRIQQARLAVVHVPHHRHHRRPRLQTFLGFFLRNLQHHLLFQGNNAHYAAERFRQRRRRRHIQSLVDAREHAT